MNLWSTWIMATTDDLLLRCQPPRYWLISLPGTTTVKLSFKDKDFRVKQKSNVWGTRHSFRLVIPIQQLFLAGLDSRWQCSFLGWKPSTSFHYQWYPLRFKWVFKIHNDGMMSVGAGDSLLSMIHPKMSFKN